MRETTQRRHAFDAYLRLGSGRTLRELREALLRDGGRAPTVRTLEEWSRQLQWQRRIDDVEREYREADDEARRAAVREMAERHAQEGVLLQQRGATWLTAIDSESVTTDSAIRALAEGVRICRLARGEATDRTAFGEDRDPRLERFSEAELEHLIDAAERAVEGAEPPPSA